MVDERHGCVLPARRAKLVERPDDPRAADVAVRETELLTVARVPRPARAVEGRLGVGDDLPDRLLGEEGEGFRIAMRILDRSRPGVAAQALGIAQGATDYALEYAKTRATMGQPIAQHQLIQAKLADMETECEAARGLLYRFGRMVDEGADDAELTKASAMAKLKCGDVAMAVTTDAVQILGGYGYIKEYPVERFMRDAKITQIYEGTQEIQRLVIAREMLKETRAFLLAGVG